MRVYTGILFFLLSIAFGYGQQPVQTIEGPGIRYIVSNSGVLFQQNGNAGFEAPIDSGIQGILSSGIWIGAKSGGNLYLAAACYDTSGSDFQPGPLDRTTGVPDEVSYWNYLWTVDSAMIEEHKTLYNNQGYQAPWDIAHWPGSTTRPGDYNPILAPFIDLNSDGKYQPDSGEVPFIYGKQASYFILNDQKTHTQSGANPLGIEVYAMVYTDPQMPDVIFARYRIVNRSNRTYDSLFAGVYTDFLLGRDDDNFISTDSNRHTYYCYNANQFDSNGYGASPAVIGVRFLQNNLGRTISFNWDPDDNLGWPVSPEHYFSYMDGRWKDGSQLQDPESPQTSYHFQGDPCANVGWTEYGSSGTVPGRRNMLGSTDPQTLAPGGVVSLDIAYIFTRKQSNVQANVCSFQQDADQVYAYWKSVLSHLTWTPELRPLRVYPNPSTGVLNFDLDEGQLAESIELIDGKGRIYRADWTDQRITLSALAPGLYLVRIRSQEGAHYTGRFVYAP